MTNEQPTSSLDSMIAPRWHTAALVALYLAVAAAGAWLQNRGVQASAIPGAGGRVVAVYLPMLVVQWGLAFYVCRVGRPRSALSALFGARWTSARRAAADVALAACGWLFIKTIELAWARFFGSGVSAAVIALLPHTVSECLMWSVVSVSVGFCEELVFRGYFQAQFEAFTGNAGAAVALQAALFGVAHGEQGAAAMARMALYGVALGALSRWRHSLAPSILCHIWTDLASGLLRL